MQASTSFSSSRSGRPRPANIFSGSRSSADDRPWPSPSFNSSMSLTNVEDVFHDPGRPSNRLRSPLYGLPPTPITAGCKPSPNSRETELPSISNILPLTSTLSSPHHLQSLSQFQGPRPDWVDKGITFTENRAQISPPESATLPRRPLSPESFNGMPLENSNAGLGLECERTPRASNAYSSAVSTLRQREDGVSKEPFSCVPRAPRIGTLELGVFPDFTQPREWDPDAIAASGSTSSHSPMRRSLGIGWSPFKVIHPSPLGDMPAPAQKDVECAAELESGMPKQSKVHGLGITFDGHPANAGVYLLDQSSTSLTDQLIIKDEQQSRENSTTKATPFKSPSQIRCPTDSAARHTGLTPLVRTTRLAPSATPTKRSVNSPATRLQDSLKRSPRSPSTKTQSKQRSEQLLSQATSAAAAHAKMKGGALSKYDKVIPKSAVGGSSPPKRGLSVRSENDIASNRSKVEDPRKMDSPWGVFGARDEWRPLAPPSISRSGVNFKAEKHEGMENATDPTSPGKRMACKTILPNPSPSKKLCGGENLIRTGCNKMLKENARAIPDSQKVDVFGASRNNTQSPRKCHDRHGTSSPPRRHRGNARDSSNIRRVAGLR